MHDYRQFLYETRNSYSRNDTKVSKRMLEPYKTRDSSNVRKAGLVKNLSSSTISRLNYRRTTPVKLKDPGYRQVLSYQPLTLYMPTKLPLWQSPTTNTAHTDSPTTSSILLKTFPQSKRTAIGASFPLWQSWEAQWTVLLTCCPEPSQYYVMKSTGMNPSETYFVQHNVQHSQSKLTLP